MNDNLERELARLRPVRLRAEVKERIAARLDQRTWPVWIGWSSAAATALLWLALATTEPEAQALVGTNAWLSGSSGVQENWFFRSVSFSNVPAPKI
mgnify:CR=1 FL=1